MQLFFRAQGEFSTHCENLTTKRIGIDRWSMKFRARCRIARRWSRQPWPGHRLDVPLTDMTTATGGGMLSREEMDAARERLPIVYVDVVPVRVDGFGTVVAVGLLLRAGEDGQIKRALVSGRVLYHERIRAALLRHVEKDLGPLALPRIPPAPQPFTVAEYFPTPG